MDIKKISILLLAFSIFALISCAGAAEIRVNSSESIQDAVNRAHSGDTIIIAPGTYNENVNISRLNELNNLVLMSESGNPADTQIVGKKADEEVVLINNEFAVTVKGFTISGAGTGKAGISLYGSKNCIIENNIFLNNEGNGINLFFSDWNEIADNTVSLSNNSLFMNNSHNNILQNNTVQDSAYGIAMRYSENNTIVNNSAYNDTSGIYLTQNSSNNTISGNNIDGNENGIYLCSASYPNNIYNNYFNNEENADVENEGCIWYLQKPIKSKNIVSGPYIGGNFWATPDGTGFSETAPDENGDGFSDTTYTSTDGNVIDRYPLVKVIVPAANFSTSVTGGTVPLTVQFTDLSQNAESRDWVFGDGTYSTEQNPEHTYTSAGKFTVNLTVSNENGTDSKSTRITVSEEIPVLLTADFYSNLVSGFAPLDVQFTDTSQNATGWNWDFGDGETSTEQNPTHTYFSAGSFFVNLTVSNENETTSKYSLINVLEKSSSSSDSTGSTSSGSSGSSGSGSSGSSGGSSSGGSAGGSPEPQSNVESRELSQVFISSGSHVKFDFTQKTTPVVYVSLDSKKTAGKITTIVEMLKGKSNLVSEPPSDDVYKFLNIWVGNSGFATSSNIENAVVCFKVEKSWVQDKKIDKSSITLNRYSDNKWNPLPTSLLNEDEEYLYFTAETPGFSPFAATGKTTAERTGIQPAADKTQTNQNENTASNAGPAAGQKQSPNSSGNGSTNNIEKGSAKMPGFNTVCGIVSVLAAFLYKRKEER